MNNKRILLISTACLGWLIAFFLLYKLYAMWIQKGNVLGAQYVTRINKDSIDFYTDDFFTYFWEPKSNYQQTVKPDWLPYVATYTNNEDRLRGSKNYSILKPENVFRIITIGDSFTYGEYVNDADTYSQKLEDMLNASICNNVLKFEVINLGVPGYDLLYTVERFNRRGSKYNPDLVLWLVNEWNALQITDVTLPLEEKILSETDAEVKQKYFDEGDYYFAGAQARKMVREEFGIDTILLIEQRALDRFSTYYYGPLVISMFHWYEKKAKDMMVNYQLQRKDTYINGSLPDLANFNGVLPDTHPNAIGHTLIARNIFDYVRANRLIPCEKNK